MNFSESIIETFLAEAKDLIAKMEEVLLKIEEGNTSLELINDFFRSAHTLKGAAGMFNFTELSSFAHEVETLLAKVRENKTTLSKGKTTVLLEIVDCLTKLLDASVNKNITTELIARKKTLLEKLNKPEIDVAKIVQVNKPQNNMDITNSSVPSQNSVVTQISDNNSNIGNSFIKISSSKLDDIINLIGEIVIAQGYVIDIIKTQLITKIDLLSGSEKLSNLIDELKDLSLQLRMLPIKEIFSKFNRVVRDVAVQKNKQIKLQIEGGRY